MSRLQRLQRLNLILFTLALIFTAILVFRSPVAATSDKESWKQQFPGFDVELARRVEIRRDGTADAPEGESITLSRTSDGSWVVASHDGYPARDESVAALLDGVAKMRVRKLVTTREDTFDKYRAFDGFTEVQVFGAGSEALAAFALGKDADRYPEVFTRVGSGEAQQILQTVHVTRSMASTRLTSWVEARLWPGLRHELMIRLDVTRDEGKLVVARRGEAPADVEADVPEAADGKVWWVVEPAPPSEPADEGAIDNLGRFFTGLRLEAVAGKAADDEAKAALGMSPPLGTVTFWQKTGDTVERMTLEIGQKTEDGRRYRVMKGGSAWVYEVPSYSLGDFLEPAGSFKPEAEPETPPDEGKDGDGGDGGDDGAGADDGG